MTSPFFPYSDKKALELMSLNIEIMPMIFLDYITQDLNPNTHISSDKFPNS